MFKRIRHITGIYLGKSSIMATTLTKGRGGNWTVDSEAPQIEESSAPISEQVRAYLSRLKPDKNRRITFAVPRNKVFYREIEFPQLTSEEALSAVRMGIDLHAHLKQDDIYFDAYELPQQDRESTPDTEHHVRILLAYTERSFLEPVIKAVKETGHSRSMGCISPVSCGMDGLLRLGGEKIFPCSVLSRQDDEIVISLHGKRGWEGSHSVSLFSDAGITQRLTEMARLYPEPFQSLIKSPVFRVGEFQLSDMPQGPVDPCSTVSALKSICGSSGMNMGLCAAGIGLKSYPEIAFQDKPRKKPFRIRIDAFQLIAIATIAGMLLATSIGAARMIRLSAKVDQVENRLSQLEKRLNPLMVIQAKIDDIEGRKQELSDFVNELPNVLDVLRELTILTPKDTWIRNFSLSNGKFRISAQGKSATACVASLRKSHLFSQVKLVSSVTKTKDDMERFSLEIIPKRRTRGKGAGR